MTFDFLTYMVIFEISQAILLSVWMSVGGRECPNLKILLRTTILGCTFKYISPSSALAADLYMT